MVDLRDGQRFLFERILTYRDVKGRRKRYSVRWRGYPPSWDSWEPCSMLEIAALVFTLQYDKGHLIV